MWNWLSTDDDRQWLGLWLVAAAVAAVVIGALVAVFGSVPRSGRYPVGVGFVFGLIVAFVALASLVRAILDGRTRRSGTQPTNGSLPGDSRQDHQGP